MINILTSEDDFLLPLYLKESIVVIYGAGEVGQQVYKGFDPKQSGVVPKVNFFIDKKASSIGKIDNITVITLASFKKMLLKFNDATFNILIATLDVEESVKIENKLTRQLAGNENTIFNLFSMIHYDLNIDKYGFRRAKRVLINPFIFEGYNHIEDFNKNPYAYLSEINIEPEYTMNTFGIYTYPEIKTKYWNSENGLRKTICSKRKYTNNIYVLGYSRIRGVGVEDRYTIPSQLQLLVDAHDYDYKVHNYSQPNHNSFRTNIMTLFVALKNIKLIKGDIVILPGTNKFQSIYDYEYLLHSMNLVKEIKLYCNQYGAELYFLYWQTIFDKPNLTQNEFDLYRYFKVSNKEQLITSETIQYFHQLTRQAANIVKSICLIHEIHYIDLSSMFSDIEMNNKIFIDSAHYTPKAHTRIAQLMFDEIFVNDSKKKFDQSTKQWQQAHIDDELKIMLTNEVYAQLDQYVKGILKSSNAIYNDLANIGSIVVNCNPFTFGHRYVIEYAASQVDLLYIFVVEENKSVYTFEERFALVQENCKDLNNVIIIPSGNFIISQRTFPSYFSKETIIKGDVISGPDVDLGIFCLKIAPELNITKRFVGEEPYCAVTSNYNAEMKKMLPKYNIEVIEIPRKEIDDEVISASKVRRCVLEEAYELLEKLVPQPTVEFLIKKHKR